MKHFYSLFILVFIWSLTHFGSDSWGLPNSYSFAIDAVPVNEKDSALDLMKIQGHVYPPLQYILWDLLCPFEKIEIKDVDHKVAVISERISDFRRIVSLMTLGSSAIIYFSGFYLLKLNFWSLFGALFFLLNPMSLYYSHTTNMDQPYVFWWCLSSAVFIYFNFSHQDNFKKIILGNMFFGFLMGCSFCTKDHVYSLYLIPLIIYSIYLGVFKSKLKSAFLLILCWVVSFSLTFYLIYFISGGLDVAEKHFNWITSNNTFVGSKQPLNSLASSCKLLFVSLQNCFTSLDYSFIYFLPVAFFIKCKSFKKNKFFLFIALIYFSFIISFIAYFISNGGTPAPRRYLPFIALFSLFIAGVLSEWKHSAKKTIFILIGISYLFIGSLQTIFSLTHNSHTKLKENILSQYPVDNKNFKLALSGSTFGYNYFYLNNGDSNDIIKKKTLINWSEFIFGFIHHNQKTTILDPLAVILMQPDILLTISPLDSEIKEFLNSIDYSLENKIQSNPSLIPNLFSYRSPHFKVFRKNSRIDDVDLKSKHDLPEELLIFASCLEKSLEKTQQKIFGKICKDFSEIPLESYHIGDGLLNSIAISYDLNNRIDSAKKAFDFLNEKFPQSIYVKNRDKFYKYRFGITNSDISKNIAK